jgi:chromosome segregation ATPase
MVDIVDSQEKRIQELEKRLKESEENVIFLKDLLSHIHSQFQEFKKDIERR